MSGMQLNYLKPIWSFPDFLGRTSTISEGSILPNYQDKPFHTTPPSSL
jgi:hypothetical protein